MKIHDLANQLELLAKFLRSLPNTKLENHPSILQHDFLGATSSVLLRQKATGLAEGAEKALVGKTPHEIEVYLSSEDNAFTVAHLAEMAKRLGIATSKRQNKRALINLIARHFEAGQMHFMMRNARTDNS